MKNNSGITIITLIITIIVIIILATVSFFALDTHKNAVVAKYVQECPNVSRVQMLRKVHDASGDRMLRLDLCKLAVRNKVLSRVTDAEFDIVFNSEGKFDI